MTQGRKKTASRKAVDPYKLEVAGRIYDAFESARRKRPRGNELTQMELGQLVAKELGLKVPIDQGTVSRWMSNTRPNTPDPPTLRAIAKTLNTQVMWLLYGGAVD